MTILEQTSSSSTGGDELPRNLFGFEVLDYIGEGAGSVIYVVASPDSSQIYALKHVKRQGKYADRFFAQLQNEFDMSRQFTHPALRRAIDLRDDRALFRKRTQAVLVMEMFDGVPLDARRIDDPVAIIDVFIQVAQGLGALHAMGLVHCDLKPNNILVNAQGQAKIIDFGQTCKLGTIKERIQGTPDFIAPEQVRLQPMTVRTDVFNLGATMYWTLTGRAIPTLFTVKKDENSFLLDQCIASPRDINSNIPDPLSNLVMECVRTNPLKRPADMQEVQRRLEIVRHAVTRRGVA